MSIIRSISSNINRSNIIRYHEGHGMGLEASGESSIDDIDWFWSAFGNKRKTFGINVNQSCDESS